MFYAPMCVYVEGIINSSTDAEDVVQEALTKTWSSDCKFNDANGLKFYLYRAVHNQAVSWLRKNGGHQSVSESLIPDTFDDDGYIAAVREEMYRQLYEAIEQLPAQQKQVMKLSMKGKTGKEIAEEMGLSFNTVKVHRQKAMDSIRRNASEKAVFLLFLADFLFLD